MNFKTKADEVKNSCQKWFGPKMKFKMQIDPSNEERKQKNLKGWNWFVKCRVFFNCKFLQYAYKRSPYVQWPVQSAHFTNTQRAPHHVYFKSA